MWRWGRGRVSGSGSWWRCSSVFKMRWVLGAIWGGGEGRGVVVVAVGRMGARYDDGGTSGEGVSE